MSVTGRVSVAGGAAQARLSPPPVPAGYATVDLEVSYRATFEEDEEGLGLGIYLDVRNATNNRNVLAVRRDSGR